MGGTVSISRLSESLDIAYARCFTEIQNTYLAFVLATKSRVQPGLNRGEPQLQQMTNEYFMRPPRAKYLSSIFQMGIARKADFYHQQMSSLSGEILRFDHTIKLAKYLRTCHSTDSPFNALATVMNDAGQVIAQAFVDDTSNKCLDDTLNALKARLDNQRKIVKAIYVDNCCTMSPLWSPH